MSTSAGTQECEGFASKSKWEKVPTCGSSGSSEKNRQIHGQFATFSIWLWKLRLRQTRLNVLHLKPHLIEHQCYNHQFELGWGSHLGQQRVPALFQTGNTHCSRLEEATKLTTFSMISPQWLAKFISRGNISQLICWIFIFFNLHMPENFFL